MGRFKAKRKRKKGRVKKTTAKKTTAKKPTPAKRAPPRGAVTYLYVLTSTSTPGKTYVGVTNDPGRRLRQHNGQLQGGARYTSRFKPWAFHAIFRFQARHDALSVEWRVKHMRSTADGKGVQGIVRRVHRHAHGRAGFQELIRV
ncbi:MAG: hypothetical protein CMI16_06400 [Opitutaceae bacterium]|nr:hypothetical protein [Opitutaceae bacterium]